VADDDRSGLYRPRVVDGELAALLELLPAIAIEGAKAVGKTATASRHAKTTYELDDPLVAEIAEADRRRLLGGERPILIDEWQRLPSSWDLVRREVDAPGTPPGSYLLTGSATPLPEAALHSGAGRIVSLRMRPLSLSERGVAHPTVSLRRLLEGTRPDLDGKTVVGLETYVDEILASGFPGIRSLPTTQARRVQLDGYLQRIVDRDFPEQGRRIRKPATLRAWLAAYAAASSQTTSFEVIRDAASPGQREKPSRKATIPYRDILQRLWVLDPVDAWITSGNLFRRLGAAQKHQLVDPGLAARLLRVDKPILLSGKDPGDPRVPRGGSLLGALFESLVTLDVRVYSQAAEADVTHLRTSRGDHEVDLIVEPRQMPGILAVEVKLGATVDDRDVRHLRWLKNELDTDLLDAIVVTTGPAAYRRADGIGVVPAALLGP
jgi:hypothetical protein